MIVTPTVHMVRAEGGMFAHAFQLKGYVGIGFTEKDLSTFLADDDRENLREFYQAENPDKSSIFVGQNVGQIWRFLHEVTIDTYVLTPMQDSSKLLVGKVNGDYSYQPDATDSPYPHRKAVSWFDKPLSRSTLSIPTQNTLRSTLSVFNVPQYDEILAPYGVKLPEKQKRRQISEDELNRLIMDQILELSADEFEILVTDLLTAVGFETEHKGRVGDGGIDVEGTLRVYDFASVDLKVQVKRYKPHSKINVKTIKDFRGSVPEKAQAAFVTTSDFNANARDEAEKEGFKKIGLINGMQLVEILIEHYGALSPEMKEKLNLRRTLIPHQ